MSRNVVRAVLVIGWLGTEAWLLLVSVGLGFARYDSGRTGYGDLSTGIGVLMLILFVGWLLCLVGGWRALRVASVLGVALLGFGLWLVAVYQSVYENDINRGGISLGILLPGVVVLGGVWLMRQTGNSADASPPRG